MRDGGCLTLHLFVTYKGFITLLGFMVLFTALLGCFTSFSTVHHLALLGPLKCLDTLDLTHLHIQDAYYFSASEMSKIKGQQVEEGDHYKDDYKGEPRGDLLKYSTNHLNVLEDYKGDSRGDSLKYSSNHLDDQEDYKGDSRGDLLNSTNHLDGQDDYKGDSRGDFLNSTNHLDVQEDYKGDPIGDSLNSTNHHDDKEDYKGDVKGDLINSTNHLVDQDSNYKSEPRGHVFSPRYDQDSYKGDRRRDLQSPKISTCTKSSALLKVFMYDLPPEYHFGMIEPMGAHNGIWPMNSTQILSYPGGLYEQHSPEYWLTLDLLLNTEVESLDDIGTLIRNTSRPCGAFRVKDPREADVFFVPFFSSLSYNKYRMRSRDVELQRKLVEFVLSQEAWKRSKGRDHIVMMHHPNSLHLARQHLRAAVFLVSDFGRYAAHVANIDKDVVAPYKHIIPSFNEDSSTFDSRPTLLFFQGAIVRKQGGIIRQRLYNILKNEKGVEFKNGRLRSHGMRGVTLGMRSSKFCLHLAGDTPSSNRLFDAIASHCVPVIISKNIELPYEGIIDYTQFCFFVHPLDALRKGFLVEFLRSIKKEEWNRMWRNIKYAQQHFEYQFPSQKDDAVQMIWKSISHKIPIINQFRHKAQRYFRSRLFKIN